MLTHYRYSLAPSIIEEMKSVKNEVEIQGLKRAYLRDGACYVQFLAWLDEKMAKGIEMAHAIQHEPYTLVVQLQSRARHTHGCCRVMWAVFFFTWGTRAHFPRVDCHRHRYLPKRHDGCATGCPCAEEFMAGRPELPR